MAGPQWNRPWNFTPVEHPEGNRFNGAPRCGIFDRRGEHENKNPALIFRNGAF